MPEIETIVNRQAAFSPQPGGESNFTVTQLLPFGLAGELPDGSRGIVREREIAWDEATLQHWRERFVIGATRKVKVLSKRTDHWELSLRLIERDPWLQVNQHYQHGLLVDGVVARFWGDSAIIELEPGVTGTLYQDELPDWIAQPIDEVLWVGDRVRVVIRHINSERREIELSTKNLLIQRWDDAFFQEKNSLSFASAEQRASHQAPHDVAPPPIVSAFHFGTSAILVIEDDPKQNEAIRRWLKNAGQMVQGAATAERGLQLLQQRPFDYLLCDLGLPVLDGIGAIQEALCLYPDLRIILMTDWATADQRYHEIAALENKGVLLLLKPILPEELWSILQRSKEKQAPEQGPKADRQLKQLIKPKKAHNIQAPQKDLLQLLHSLRNQTRASKVVLFHFDTQNRTIQINGQSGSIRLDMGALAKLIYSPVRDIAEDGLTVHIDDTLEHEAYVRYLKPLLRFRSCVGIPIIVNQGQRYALLLFHSEPGFTGSVIEQEAYVTAIQIRALIEQQNFLEQASELQRTVLLGHLSRALIHETNHQLNPILFSLSDLKRQFSRLHQAIETQSTSISHEAQEAQQMLQELTDNVQKLVKISRMFGRVTVQDQEELVRVDQVAEQSLELVRDLADRAAIKLHFHPAPAPLITKTKFTQVQQVLLNLLLNAVQQIQLIRPRKGGNIHISFGINQSPDSVNIIRVLIEDDGPGIHRRLWERIFDLGVTTRQGEGSGMGLFIARRLVENASGHVFVSESRPLWGTCMAAEFPLYHYI